MSIQVKRRRESAAFLSTYVGAPGELIVDTTNNRVQVHDGVTPGGFPAAKLSEIGTAGGPPAPGGRLTLSSATPVMTTSVLGAATIYYVPYCGGQVPLWNGSAFVATPFSQISQVLSDTTRSPAAAVENALYDLFVWNNAGVPTLSRGPLWSQTTAVTMTIASPCVVTWGGNSFTDNQPIVFTTTGALPTGLTAGTTYYVKAAGPVGNTFQIAATPGGTAINTTGSQSGTHTAVGGSYVSRGTGAGTTQLQRTNGIMNNQNAITNGPAAGFGTYVGTIKTNASAAVDWNPGGASAGGTAGVLSVWNMYNRRWVSARVNDTTASWTYALAAPRFANNSTGNRINFLSGLAEDGIEANYFNEFGVAAIAGSFMIVGFGMDVTATFDRYYFGQTAAAFANFFAGGTHGSYAPQLGWHYISAMEASDGTHTGTMLGGSLNGSPEMNLEVSLLM